MMRLYGSDFVAQASGQHFHIASQLTHDQVYVTTIKNIVETHVGQKASAAATTGAGDSSGRGPVDKATCNWRTDDNQTQKLFTTVAEMLLKVSDCQMAVACGNWIVKTLPMGLWLLSFKLYVICIILYIHIVEVFQCRYCFIRRIVLFWLSSGSEKVLALKAMVCLAKKWLDACTPEQVGCNAQTLF